MTKGKWPVFAAVAAVTALLCAVWSGAAFARSTANGSLEICKAPDNGTTGSDFSFTATKGAKSIGPVIVGGNTCSAPLPAAAGNWTITEDLSSGIWQMVGATVVPGTDFVGETNANGTVKVTVVAGAETQITVTNAGALSTIKVCKTSNSFLNTQYSFTVGATTVTAKSGATAGVPGLCSQAVTAQPGTKLTITESTPTNEVVANVTGSSNLTIKNVKGSVAKVVTGSGANVITFDNEASGPSQTGLLEVCKNAGDAFISGSFTFTVTDTVNPSQTVDVLPGQCSGPLTVQAGNVNVAEKATQGTFVSNIALGPNSAGFLGVSNPNNGTATVVVPVAAAGEAQVVFTNSTITTSLKVCKFLTATSGALAGTKFNFTVVDAAGTQTVSIVASAAKSGACKNVTAGGAPVVVPVGSTVTTTEAAMPFVSGDGNPVNTPDVQTTTAGPTINTIPFTNQAYGQLEICKNILASDGTSYNGTVFSFTVSGIANPIQVAAGRCSPPQVVPAGSYTVNETPLPYGFQFESSTATGPSGNNRATSGTATNGGNPLTVTVPFYNDTAPNNGETDIKFVNSVQRAFVKICKLIDPLSATNIGGDSFSFNVSVNGVPQVFPPGTTTVSPPYPGPTSCTDKLLDVPVIQPGTTSTPTTITVTENMVTDTGVKSVTVDNIAPIPPGTAPTTTLGPGGGITFNPGQGVDVVTFTNDFEPTVVYNAIPNPLAPGYPSEPFQAVQSDEFGDEVLLAGTARDLQTVSVTFDTWAYYSEWASDPRYTGTQATGWSHPITINVYGPTLDANNHPTTLLGTITQNASIPWRPEPDPVNCPPGPGNFNNDWFSGGTCYTGLAFNSTFDLSSLGITLPNEVIVSVEFNTESYGPSPIGVDGPYDSLNVALPPLNVPSVGVDANPNAVFFESSNLGQYSDPTKPAGIFREDSPWAPYGTVPFKITAS